MKKIVCLYGTPNEIVNQLNAKAVDYAAARGLEYQWIPMQPFSNDAAVEALKGADAGIIDVEVYDKDIFTRINDSVKILVRYGVGFDAVNLKDATDAGIAIARTTAANAEGVAEMAFTMIMAAKRQLMRNRDCVNTGNWVRNVGGERASAPSAAKWRSCSAALTARSWPMIRSCPQRPARQPARGRWSWKNCSGRVTR